MSRDKSEIEVPSWRDDMDLLYDDEKSEGAQTLDDSRKRLQDFADARSDKYLSVKRMIRMGHKLLADNPGLHFKDTADWVPYLIMVRKWCEASEQEVMIKSGQSPQRRRDLAGSRQQQPPTSC